MEGRKSIQKGQGNAPTVIPTAPPQEGGGEVESQSIIHINCFRT